ncbi:MAG: trypsin-like peptidase domain-containing protein [Clostridia bacterium]|nr:trypsin-like peptidase domain-containing protein [Clostridia bacterium]
MTNEFENDLFSGAQTPEEPQSDPQPAASEPAYGGSIFDKTVFGAAEKESDPSNGAEAPAQPQSDPQPTASETAFGGSIFDKTVFGAAAAQPSVEPQPEKPAVENEPVVTAERVTDYAPPASGSAYQPQQAVPPYGRPNSVPPYGQSVPPYGQRTTNYGQPFTPPAQTGYYTAPRSAEPAPQPQKKSGKGLKAFLAVIALIVVAGVMFGVGALIGGRHRQAEIAQNGDDNAASAQIGAPELETKASPSADKAASSGSSLTPTQIAAKVRPWSVGILVYSKSSSGVASEGSGVLWKEDSSHTYTYIITCAHVVNGSGLTYSVQTEDNTTYDAELVGLDAKTDLGVLRIKKTGLELAEFGDSSKLQVGDPVYAIGNPGGTEFFGSFTSGIVSAIDRSVKSTYTMVCIQHTAAINPGNSGGALVNQYGQVVGINSQKIISTDYEGMGFSIPIKSAQSIVNSLASYGYVKDRPKLGITYAEAINYQQYNLIIKIKGMPSGSLIITDINDDSSLANTEVRKYDMITAVNGEKMTKPEVLLSKIENGKVGDKLTLTICRLDNNYQTTEFTVTATLVEEKKETEKETTTQKSVNPYDFFNDDFFNGLF